ncbi:hypothetical protein Tco_0533310 [Tanacetum coccineum]
MASTRASISKAFKRPKINIIPPKQLFVDLTHDNTKTPSPTLQLSSPSAPNAPSKTPSTKDTSSSSIDYIPKSPTSSTSLSPNGYLNPPTSPPPRVSPLLTQENASMDITLTLSPITPLDVQFDTPSPSPPILDQLNTAYRSSDTIAESYSSYLISELDFLSFFRANLADIFTFVIGRANRRISIEEDTTRIMTELILKECMENAQVESSLAKSNTDNDRNIELSKEFLKELRSNAYHRMFDEDVVDHIAKVLEILDLIKMSNVDTHRLRMKFFPLSLADDARQWWIDEGDGKITTWKELVEKFFCKFYPLSHDGKDEMLKEGDNWGIDPLEFISRVNSLFKNHGRVNGTTKKELLHSWINESWNKEPINDIVSSDEEWEESDNGNPPNATTDSFFKPYFGAHDIEKEDE